MQGSTALPWACEIHHHLQQVANSQRGKASLCGDGSQLGSAVAACTWHRVASNHFPQHENPEVNTMSGSHVLQHVKSEDELMQRVLQ